MFSKLIEKITKEFEEYENKLLSLDNYEIIENFYEYTIKKEIVEMFENSYGSDDTCNLCISDDDIKKLNKMEYPLSFIYNEWLDCDISIYSQFETFIENIRIH